MVASDPRLDLADSLAVCFVSADEEGREGIVNATDGLLEIAAAINRLAAAVESLSTEDEEDE